MAKLGNDISTANPTGGGTNLRDGKYKLCVERFFEQSGYTGDCVIAEFRVLEAEATEEGVKPNAVGSSCSSVWNVTKQKEAARGNVMAFLMAMFDCDKEEITAERYAECVDDEHMLRGFVINAETFRKANQGRQVAANAGKIMTVPKFIHYPDNTEEAVEEQKKMLAAPKKPAREGAAEVKPASSPEAKPGKFGGIFKKS